MKPYTEIAGSLRKDGLGSAWYPLIDELLSALPLGSLLKAQGVGGA